MKSVNALSVRKSLGAVLRTMEENNEPVLVTKDRQTVAALVPIQLFKQRFTDLAAREEIETALRELESLQASSDGKSIQHLRSLREARA